MKKLAVLLFPSNWSACTSAPHLALPLLAGVARSRGWRTEYRDLTQEFLACFSERPTRDNVLEAAARRDFGELDRLYFRWEDRVRAAVGNGREGRPFRLLSGVDFGDLSSRPLHDVAVEVRTVGTPFRRFHELVVADIETRRPPVIAVTVTSVHQIVPVIELLQLLREALPDTFVVLGGNIITRLRLERSLEVFRKLVDQVALFQGELCFARTLDTIARDGPVRARLSLPKTDGDERIPLEVWPVPDFSGVNFDAFPGVPSVPYVSTRGCYWGRCHFCAIPAGWSIRGYAGSAPPELVRDQLVRIAMDTGISRFKFVDEALAPAKAARLGDLVHDASMTVEWEAYARLERLWQDPHVLERASGGGLKKLYFGLEQAPGTDRTILNKNDSADIDNVLQLCRQFRISVHLFCMVGHPRSTPDDAWETTRYLIANRDFIDTADLVGFRLDRGTSVPGIVPRLDIISDWAMAIPWQSTEPGILTESDVSTLEIECQEALWQSAPHLLHPLFRLAGTWSAASHAPLAARVPERRSS